MKNKNNNTVTICKTQMIKKVQLYYKQLRVFKVGIYLSIELKYMTNLVSYYKIQGLKVVKK